MRQLKIQKSITNRSSEALDKYLVEIGREPLVSIEEEIELAQAIRKGGPEGERAKEKLVKANLRFVVSVAKQYQHQGLSLLRNLMRHADSSSFLMPFGGFGKAFCRLLPSRVVLFVCHSTKWERSLRLITRSVSSNKRICVSPLWPSWQR